MAAASKWFSCWEFCHWITSCCMRSASNLQPQIQTENDDSEKPPQVVYSSGPCGGLSGDVKDILANPNTRILKVMVQHGKAINAIRILYYSNKKEEWTDWWGGNGEKLSEVNLDADEYLRSINGWYGIQDNYYVIKSLTFISNKKVYGPYGEESGASFKFDAQQGKIVGFFGRCSRSSGYLYALGVHIAT